MPFESGSSLHHRLSKLAVSDFAVTICCDYPESTIVRNAVEPRLERSLAPIACQTYAAFGIQDDLLLEHIFDAMDEDKSGKINFQEFVTSLSTIFRGDEDDILHFWFKMYDREGSGLLHMTNLRRMLRDGAQAKRKKLQVLGLPISTE